MRLSDGRVAGIGVALDAWSWRAEFALAWREGGVRRRCAGRLELEGLSLRLRDGRVVCVGAVLDAWRCRS